MTHYDIAQAFFDACETGQGWITRKTWCAADAFFSRQADALAATKTLAAYCNWTKGHPTPVPDGGYELTAFAWDYARQTAIATAEFHGTQTGEGLSVGFFMVPGLFLALPAGYLGRLIADREMLVLGLVALALGGIVSSMAGAAAVFASVA